MCESFSTTFASHTLNNSTTEPCKLPDLQISISQHVFKNAINTSITLLLDFFLTWEGSKILNKCHSVSFCTPDAWENCIMLCHWTTMVKIHHSLGSENTKKERSLPENQIGASSEIKGKPGGSYLGGSEKGVSRKRVTSYTKCHWTHHKG